MTYAIIEIQGKQFKVKPGDEIKVDKLEVEEGTKLPLDKILLTVDGEKISIGTPYLSGTNLEAEVLSHSKDAKIRVAKYRSKSRYRRVKGHRQAISIIKILAASASKSATSSADNKATKPKSTAKKASK